MLSLFLVASLLLPSVLGKYCCMPDKLSMSMNGYRVHSHVLIDFTQNKYIETPYSGEVKFRLHDLSKEKQYIIFDDGSCQTSSATEFLQQCFTAPFKEVGGTSKGIQRYSGKFDEVTLGFSVTDDCLPVSNSVTAGGRTATVVYSNVTTSVSDVSVLNQDISACK